MPNKKTEKQHALVASALGVDINSMKDHPYDLDVENNGYLLVRWHDQAPDGVIREGKLGSYITYIRHGNHFTINKLVNELVR